jgi:hypothetical protein
MKRTTTVGLAAVGGFIALLVVVSASVIDLSRPAGLRGAAIGAGLGLLNLLAGYFVTKRALRHGMKSAMRTLLTGFFLRLVTVAALIVVFQRTAAVDAVAFALSFLVFFFVYLGLEVLLVERSLNGTGRAA